MKKMMVLLSATILISGWTFSSYSMVKLPNEITDDLMKTVAVELLIKNIQDPRSRSL